MGLNDRTPTLEEKIEARVKEQIGDLVSDEDLKRIIEKGIHKALFASTYEPA